jgi:hypothetical protein
MLLYINTPYNRTKATAYNRDYHPLAIPNTKPAETLETRGIPIFVAQTDRTILYIFLYYIMQDTSIRLHYIMDDIVNLHHIILVD